MKVFMIFFFAPSFILHGAAPWAKVIKPSSHLIGEVKPAFTFAVGPQAETSTVKVFLDNVEVTAFVKQGDEGWMLIPPTPLSEGKHKLLLKGKDHRDVPLPPLTLSFHVKPKQQLRGSMDGTLEDMYHHELSHHNIEHEGDSRNGSATLSLTVESNHMNQFLNISTVYTSPQPVSPSGRKIDLSSAVYTLSYQKETLQATASLGQVSYSASPLAISGYGTRGSILKVQGSHVGVEVFSLDTRRPFGWTGHVGPGRNTKDHINGIRLSGMPVKGWEIYTIYLQGAEPSPFSPTTGSEETPRKAKVKGAGMTIQRHGWSGLAEAFTSQDLEDNYKTHSSYRLMLAKQGKEYQSQVSFQHVDKGYQTPGIPYLADNRNQGEGMFQWIHGKTSLTLTVGYQYEKGMEKDIPGLVQWQEGITLSQQISETLSFNASIQGTEIKPDKKPALLSPQAQTTNSSVGLSYNKGIHSLQGSANYTRLDDKSENDSDNQAYGYNVMYAVRPASWMTITSSVQLNLSRTTFFSPYTRQTTLNLDLRSTLFHNALNLDLGGSLSRTDQEDLLQGNTYTAIQFRAEYAPPLGIPWGRGSFSLSANYVHTDMELTNLSTLQIFLSANFSITGRHSYGQ